MNERSADRPLHALIVHGLNNSPEAMVPIADRLKQMGIGVSVVKLTGHWEPKDRLKFFRQVTSKTWLQDTEKIYAEIARTQNDKDLILVGYSLGALLGILLAQSGKARFKKMLLFAPALYLHRWSYLPKLLTFLNLNIPSATPFSLRANPYTPVNAYKALFDLVEQFDPAKHDTPTLVVMNPKDELVDFRQVKNWAQQSQKALFLPLQKTSGTKHLIVNETCVGPSNWDLIWTEIESFIGRQECIL